MASAATARPLRANWLVGAVPEGLVFVGERHTLEVPLPMGGQAGERAARLLASGAPESELAEAAAIEPAEAAALLDSLKSCDAFEPPDAVARGPFPWVPLRAALAGDRLEAAEPLAHAFVATADELLLIPSGLGGDRLAELLHDFLAGIAPLQRRRAYCHALGLRRVTLYGDAPTPSHLEAGLAGVDDFDPRAAHVLDLRSGACERVELTGIGAVGAFAPHRLGTVLRCERLARADLEPLGFGVALADHALADVTRAEHPSLPPLTKGVALEWEQAELIARAEAAERFAGGYRASVEVRRAKAVALDAYIDPNDLQARNARQRAQFTRLLDFDPEVGRPWVRARRLDGAGEAWAPAEAVLCPFVEPDAPGLVLGASSSGLAAGRDLETATASALRELVERDAFMWTWVQRLSRERIELSGLPELERPIGALRARGFEVDLVNLTMETDPVILCVIHAAGTLTVGASCDPDRRRAAAAALREAAVTRVTIPDHDPVPPAQDVRLPADHDAHYRAGEAAADARFLHSGGEWITIDDVGGCGLPVAEAIAGIGEPVGTPLAVDLSSPRTAPFAVVRALVPGLVPIAFGYDAEPLGMALLARSRRTADGRRLGRELELDNVGPLRPHPFA